MLNEYFNRLSREMGMPDLKLGKDMACHLVFEETFNISIGASDGERGPGPALCRPRSGALGQGRRFLPGAP